jgi:hypothetical protein
MKGKQQSERYSGCKYDNRRFRGRQLLFTFWRKGISGSRGGSGIGSNSAGSGSSSGGKPGSKGSSSSSVGSSSASGKDNLSKSGTSGVPAATGEPEKSFVSGSSTSEAGIADEKSVSASKTGDGAATKDNK